MVDDNEERKYRAGTFNFGGFALMAPLGHIVMDPISLLKQFEIAGFILYAVFCFCLFIAGFYLIDIGRDILFRRK